MEIREAELNDYKDVLDIYNSSFYEKYNFVTETYQGDLVDDFGSINLDIPGHYYVAHFEGIILGLIILKARDRKSIPIRPRISPFKLIKKYGFKGIFKALKLADKSDYKPAKGELFIDALGVDERYRGRGVGTTLLHFAVSQAIRGDYEKLTLEVMIENIRAKSLYERFGFKVISKKEYPEFKESSGYSGKYLLSMSVANN